MRCHLIWLRSTFKSIPFQLFDSVEYSTLRARVTVSICFLYLSILGLLFTKCSHISRCWWCFYSISFFRLLSFIFMFSIILFVFISIPFHHFQCDETLLYCSYASTKVNSFDHRNQRYYLLVENHFSELSLSFQYYFFFVVRPLWLSSSSSFARFCRNKKHFAAHKNVNGCKQILWHSMRILSLVLRWNSTTWWWKLHSDVTKSGMGGGGGCRGRVYVSILCGWIVEIQM